MRKLVALIAVAMLIIPLLGSAEASSIKGWVSIPGVITAGDTRIELRDVSLEDGSLMGVASNGTSSVSFVLRPGNSFSFGGVNLTYLRVLVDSRSFAMLRLNFSPILPGQNVSLDDYVISLLSVGGSGAKVRVSKGNESKEFTSKDFTFRDVHVSIEAYPKVFDGYLERGHNVSAYGHVLTFSNATVENTTEGLVETVFFTYLNGTYGVKVGEEADIGVFHVKVSDLIGIDYAKVAVNFVGASISVETVLDAELTLSPGQSAKVGPYLLSYDYYFGGAAVSLRNSCGEVLRSAKLSTGRVSSLLYYGGAVVGLENVSNNGTATFFALVDEDMIPSPTDVANLLITVSSSGGKQYTQMTAKVSVLNTGTVKLSNVSLKFVPAGDLSVVSDGKVLIRELKPGEKRTLEVTLLPEISGNVSLGHVEARVVAPFELACGGYTVLTFRSNELKTYVEPSTVAYSLKVNVPDEVRIYHPAVVDVTVVNRGDVTVPANLTISLPEGVAVEPGDGFESRGNLIIAPLSLLPGDNTSIALRVVPYTEGPKEFRVSIEAPIGPANSTVATINVFVPRNNATSTTVTKTVTETKTVPSNGTVTVTETYTKTETKVSETTVPTPSPVPYTPTTSKILWLGVGFLIGVAAIIAFAWYQARRE